MRRPLCLACLMVTAFIFVCSRLFPAGEQGDYTKDRQTVTIAGRVKDKEYQLRNAGTEAEELFLILTIQDAAETGRTNAQAACGCVRCQIDWENRTAGGPAVPAIGSGVLVRGKLRIYRHATNPGEFDQKLYYKTLRIDCALNDAEILAVDHRCNPVREKLWQFREKLAAVLDATCEREDASILKAILLGEKGYLTEEIRDLYKESGIIHILAISGLHISVIGMGIYRLLRKGKLPVPVCCIISVAVMLLYGEMTGYSASSFRAIVMFLLHMWAILIHRTYDLLTAVSVAAVLILIEQPLYLYNSGFLFSFGAVYAIGLLLPALPGKAMKIFAVPLFTLPVYLSFYGTFPLLSLLLNLFVLPLMTAVMLLGLLILSCGSIWLPLGILCSLPEHLILCFYREICLLSRGVPGSTIVPGESGICQILVYYLLLCLCVYWKDTAPDLVRILICAEAAALLLLRVNPGVTLEVLDVGQGDGIFISYDTFGTDHYDVDGLWDHGFSDSGRSGMQGHAQTGRSKEPLANGTGGLRLMIDGGSTTKTDVGQYEILPFLENRGAGVIDLWIITHGDEDHTSGLTELLAMEHCTIRIGGILLPSDASGTGNSGENIEKIRRLAAQRGIPVGYLCEGMEIRAERNGWKMMDGENDTGSFERRNALSLLCLHPEADAVYADANSYSCALLVRYGRFTALLPGDLEREGETRCLSYMTSHPELFPKAADKDPGTADEITLLKVAHHGSSGATSSAFLSAIHPRLSVISCGWNNRYGHPHRETLDRLRETGTRIYDTRYCGALRFHSNGKTLQVQGYTTLQPLE